MNALRSRPADGWTRLAWSGLALASVLYASFALWMGVAELWHLLGLAPAGKLRAVPPLFVLHALAGGVALAIAPFPFLRAVRARPRLHRNLGWTYIVGVQIASVAAFLELPWFDVPAAAKGVFAAVSVLWFLVTTAGRSAIRRRRVAEHREWMIRSFALSLFFVTFTAWIPALEASPLPRDVAYPLGLLLTAAGNLAVAEWRIRRTRRRPAPLPSAASSVAPPPEGVRSCA